MFHFEKTQKLRLLVVDVDKGQDPTDVSPEACVSDAERSGPWPIWFQSQSQVPDQ
jgi:hypothetical protein